MMKSSLVLLLICWSSTISHAGETPHKRFDMLLKRYVRKGTVDYAKLAKRDAAKLAKYLEYVGQASLPEGRQRQLAFYLNAYNALVIQAIIKAGIPNSVMDVKGFFKEIKYRVAGRQVSLDELENTIIRPTFRDPRIHFALVCGARSCPPLSRDAFTAKNVGRRLDLLTRKFINSRAGVRFGEQALEVSKIFEWYAADFKKSAGSVLAFIARYRRGGIGKLSADKRRKMLFLSYDWRLNAR